MSERATSSVKLAFLNAVEKHSMLTAFEGGVLVALSGGADSVMLLSLMHGLALEKGFEVKALHVNHMIRGADADADEALCVRLCERLSVPLTVERADVPRLARERGKGLEECAREVRYELLERAIESDPSLSCIVTAHNASDNAETVLFNLMRGAGLRAMCGIPFRRENILRPLLLVPKSEILSEVQVLGYEYATDLTNDDTDYSRNYIRKEIIPRLSHLNPSPERAFSRMCENVSSDMSFIEEAADAAFNAAVKDGVSSVPYLSALHPSILYRVLVRMLMAHLGSAENILDKSKSDKLCRLIYANKQNFTYDITGEIRFVCERGSCSFAVLRSTCAEEYDIELKMGENKLPSGAFLYLFDEERKKFSENAKNVYRLFIPIGMGFDKMDTVLHARSRKEGDRVRFGGMSRKVKKLLCDSKLSRDVRSVIPMVCMGEEILWIPMIATSDFVKKSEHKVGVYAYFCYNGGNNEK